MRRRPLEPPEGGGAAVDRRSSHRGSSLFYNNTNNNRHSTSLPQYEDPPCAPRPDPSVVAHGSSAGDFLRSYNNNNEQLMRGRDPSIVHGDALQAAKIQLSSRQLELLAKRREQPVLSRTAPPPSTSMRQSVLQQFGARHAASKTITTAKTSSITTSNNNNNTENASNASTVTSASSPSQERVLLRSLLAKANHKKPMTNAKKTLLQSVLSKQQHVATNTSATASANNNKTNQQSEANSNHSDASSTARERWKQLQAEKKRTSSTATSSKKQHEKAESLALNHTKINHTNSKKGSWNIRQRYGEKVRGKSFKQQQEEEEEFEQGYQTFVKTLSEESSSVHSQLWESFSALFQNRPAHLVLPPKASKTIKFDAATHQIVKQINSHLKSTYPRAVGKGTLVMNDKKFRKAVKEGTASIGLVEPRNRHRRSEKQPEQRMSLEEETTNDDEAPFDESASRYEMQSDFTESSSRYEIKPERSSDNSSPTDPNDSKKEDDDDDSRYHVASNNDSRYSIPDSKPLSSQDLLRSKSLLDRSVSLSQSSSSEDPPQALSADLLRAKSLMDTVGMGISSSSSFEFPDAILQTRSLVSSSVVSSSQPMTAVLEEQEDYQPEINRSDTGMEMTLGQYKDEITEPDWRTKLRKSMGSVVSVASSSSSSATPEFAQVRLRKVERRTSAPSSLSLASTVESDTGTAVESTAVAEEEEGLRSMPSEAMSASIVSSLAESSVVTKPPPTPKEEPEGPLTIVLAPDANGSVSKVVMTNSMICKVRSDDTVLWTLPRNQVRSLTLDTATQSLILLLQGGRKKALSFKSSDNCLAFTNGFYESKQPTGDDDNDTVEGTSVASEDEDHEQSSWSETLNPEEQEVLKEYRKLRKTKGADDAMQESITQRIKAVGSLTSGQEEVAQKYRGMLRMNFPLSVVKHKMSNDGVDDTVVDTIVAEANTQPPEFVSAQVLPSSPVSTFSHSCAFSLTEMEAVETYRKLLQVEGSAAVVRQRMMRDNIDLKIVACVLGDDEDGDEAVVKKYQNMLKMSVPPEAVRHRMKRDQVSDKIVQTVFVDEKEEMNEEEEKAAAKYKRMLKMGIENDAVRHSMMKDGVSARVVEAVLGASEKKQPPAELTEEENAKAKRFRMMLKMGVERDGVRHSMVKEGIDVRIIEAVLGSDDEAKMTEEAPVPIPTKATKKSDLTEEEESVASDFRKLLRLQIPKRNVLQRMKQEGIADKIISAVLGSSFVNPSEKSSNDSSGNGSKFVSLHWTPLSGKELDDSVWSIASKKRNAPAAEETGPADTEINMLIELFQKKSKVPGARAKKKTTMSDGNGKAKILDLTRANNIAIGLKAFKDFSFKGLADIIAFLDPLRQIRGERAQFIRDLLPTQNEIKLIREYDGGDNRLEPAELWFRHLIDIKRIDAKVQVLRTMEMFNSEAVMIMDSFDVMTEVCQQVIASDKLQDLLEMVLSIGNIMNEGTRTGGASGFKFDSLLRLTQTKSSDGKTTVLDFLVNVFVEKGERDTLHLSADFPSCHKASRMLVSDMLKDVKDLGESLEHCKSELEALQIDVAPKPTPVPPIDPEPLVRSNDPRAAMLEALKSRGVVTAQKEKFVASRTSTMSSGHEVIDCIESLPSEDSLDQNSIHGAIDRLQRFLAIETETYADLLQKREDALQSCRDMAKYCGEAGGVGATVPLLSVLAEFASNIDVALKKHDDRIAAANRSRRQKAKDISCDASAQSVVTTGSETKEAKKSLVLMVNEMLKDANDRTREDFRKGRVAHNPSNHMQAIYELEKDKIVVSSPDAERLDIVSSIREREGSMDTDDFRKARSKFSGVSPSSDSMTQESKEVGSVQPLPSKDGNLKPLASASEKHGSPSVCVAPDATTSKQTVPATTVEPIRKGNAVADAVKMFSQNKSPLSLPRSPYKPVAARTSIGREQVSSKPSVQPDNRDTDVVTGSSLPTVETEQQEITTGAAPAQQTPQATEGNTTPQNRMQPENDTSATHAQQSPKPVASIASSVNTTQQEETPSATPVRQTPKADVDTTSSVADAIKMLNRKSLGGMPIIPKTTTPSSGTTFVSQSNTVTVKATSEYPQDSLCEDEIKEEASTEMPVVTNDGPPEIKEKAEVEFPPSPVEDRSPESSTTEGAQASIPQRPGGSTCIEEPKDVSTVHASSSPTPINENKIAEDELRGAPIDCAKTSPSQKASGSVESNENALLLDLARRMAGGNKRKSLATPLDEERVLQAKQAPQTRLSLPISDPLSKVAESNPPKDLILPSPEQGATMRSIEVRKGETLFTRRARQKREEMALKSKFDEHAPGREEEAPKPKPVELAPGRAEEVSTPSTPVAQVHNEEKAPSSLTHVARMARQKRVRRQGRVSDHS